MTTTDPPNAHPASPDGASQGENAVEPWVSVLHLLADVDQLHAQVDRILELLPTESRALLAVWSTGGLTAGDLARRIKLSNAATTTLVDRLEQRKLVQRTRLESNKRFVVITPTQRAIDRLATIGRFVQDLFDLHADTAPDQARELERSLHVLRRLLDETTTTIRLTPDEVDPPSLDELPIRADQTRDD